LADAEIDANDSEDGGKNFVIIHTEAFIRCGEINS
jgi:hypothetical protein